MKPAAPVRILVVDDHTIVRQGLRSILDLEPDFTVVGEAADAGAGHRGDGAAEPRRGAARPDAQRPRARRGP